MDIIKNKSRIKPGKEKQDELLCVLINEYHSTFDGIIDNGPVVGFFGTLKI